MTDREAQQAFALFDYDLITQPKSLASLEPPNIHSNRRSPILTAQFFQDFQSQLAISVDNWKETERILVADGIADTTDILWYLRPTGTVAFHGSILRASSTARHAAILFACHDHRLLRGIPAWALHHNPWLP
jgi:hypothetical protein